CGDDYSRPGPQAPTRCGMPTFWIIRLQVKSEFQKAQDREAAHRVPAECSATDFTFPKESMAKQKPPASVRAR
ncbi:hypothetical protein, partial [Mesorhizobium sp.]|uniref:hypothetical protein n=1 Tax=Mesorhizobium sp. TaxID=1871066 RepID=UPI0025F55145